MVYIGSGIRTTSDLVWWSQMTHQTFLHLTLPLVGHLLSQNTSWISSRELNIWLDWKRITITALFPNSYVTQWEKDKLQKISVVTPLTKECTVLICCVVMLLYACVVASTSLFLNVLYVYLCGVEWPSPFHASFIYSREHGVGGAIPCSLL